jgi:hypothetical protein
VFRQPDFVLEREGIDAGGLELGGAVARVRSPAAFVVERALVAGDDNSVNVAPGFD